MYTLKNKKGMTVDIIERGASVVSIHVPDKHDRFADVIIGFDDPEDFKNNTVFFGTIAGRYANRIANGKFHLNGKEFRLTINHPPNHLHGGNNGLHSKMWQVLEKQEDCIKLSCSSPDGEDGYPGNVNVTVTYYVTSDNALKIEYLATTDAPTIMNLTNHSYFNLTADQQSTVLDHEIFIDADAYTVVDKYSIPTGELGHVCNTPLDFLTRQKIGKRINDSFEQIRFANGYDHNFVLNHFDGRVRKVASVFEASSGRILDVLTDQPGLQFYTGNYLAGIKGKKGTIYRKRSGLCLEAQLFPDSPNHSHFPSSVIDPDNPYRQTTIYKFSTKKF